MVLTLSEMALRGLLLFSIMWYLLQRATVEGGHRRLSPLKIEKERELLNKPALKHIKTQFGDVYDCMDFYEQPAFDHPLLKDNKYDHRQMGPNLLPIITNQEPKRINQTSEIGLPRGECPSGTVPIQRITKKNLIGERLLKEKYGGRNGDKNTPGTPYRAVARTNNGSNRKYGGGRTSISVYQPSVVGSQYTTGLVTLGNGLDTITAGWMVCPDVYGDALARLFIHTITNTTACFNSCAGFVTVSTRVPLGTVLEPVSIPGDETYDQNFFIFREQESGRWWLSVGHTDSVGYWPPEIFNGLKDFASYVEWGGEANTIPGNNGPDMGSGKFPIRDPLYDAYSAEISVLNEKNEIVDAGTTEVINENGDYYKAVDAGTTELGHTVVFGGPGPKN